MIYFVQCILHITFGADEITTLKDIELHKVEPKGKKISKNHLSTIQRFENQQSIECAHKFSKWEMWQKRWMRRRRRRSRNRHCHSCCHILWPWPAGGQLHSQSLSLSLSLFTSLSDSLFLCLSFGCESSSEIAPSLSTNCSCSAFKSFYVVFETSPR